MRMAMRIRVTTRADLFEKRKQQHIERGYRIEEERPIPVNGLCSFVAVSEIPDSDGVGALVAEALNGWRDETTWKSQAGIFPVARGGSRSAKTLLCLPTGVPGAQSLRGRWRGVHPLPAWRTAHRYGIE